MTGATTTEHYQQQRASIAEARFEDYRAWQYEKMRLDELTGQSERLASPMNNKFEYVDSPEGLLLETTIETSIGPRTQREPVRGVLERGIQLAEDKLVGHPEWRFEVERRRIELEEWEQIEAFARGEKIAEALVVFSPHPDALNQGVLYIDGYNRERRKTMVRTVTRSARGVRIGSMSLDQTNYKALQESVAVLGHQLPDNMTSEEILAQRYWVQELAPDGYEWSDVVRRTYDLSLTEQFGGEWYAGRRPIEVKDALAFIKQQPDLIEQHMQAMQSVMQSVQDARQRAQQLEMHRYNFAAALDARLNGQEVDSVAEAGDSARAEGKSFEPECPQLNSPEEQLALQGYSLRKERKGRAILCTCPFCQQLVRVDPCASHIICPECATEVKDGVVIKRTNPDQENQKMLGRQALRAVTQQQLVSEPHEQIGDVRLLTNGEKAVFRESIGIGSAKRAWVNQVTGREVESKQLFVSQAA